MHTLDLVAQLLDSPDDPATIAQLVDDALTSLPRANPRREMEGLLAGSTLYGLPQPFYAGARGRAATPVEDPVDTLGRLYRPRREDAAVVLEVPQCHALALPTDRIDAIWLEAALSECSLLLATGPDRLIAAHVGFSLAHEARAALALARAFGCTDLAVVCPDDLTHTGTPYPDDQPRMTVADWRAASCRTVAFDARHTPGHGWTGLARPVFHAGRLHVLRGDTDRAARSWQPNGLLAA